MHLIRYSVKFLPLLSEIKGDKNCLNFFEFQAFDKNSPHFNVRITGLSLTWLIKEKIFMITVLIVLYFFRRTSSIVIYGLIWIIFAVTMKYTSGLLFYSCPFLLK